MGRGGKGDLEGREGDDREGKGGEGKEGRGGEERGCWTPGLKFDKSSPGGVENFTKLTMFQCRSLSDLICACHKLPESARISGITFHFL